MSAISNEHLNTALGHIIHFVNLLSIYLHVHLPFNLIFRMSHSSADVFYYSPRSTPATSPTSAVTSSFFMGLSAEGRQNDTKDDPILPNPSIPVHFTPSSGAEAFAVGLAMLNYQVVSLCHSQGVMIAKRHMMKTLENLIACCHSPNLGYPVLQWPFLKEENNSIQPDGKGIEETQARNTLIPFRTVLRLTTKNIQKRESDLGFRFVRSRKPKDEYEPNGPSRDPERSSLSLNKSLSNPNVEIENLDSAGFPIAKCASRALNEPSDFSESPNDYDTVFTVVFPFDVDSEAYSSEDDDDEDEDERDLEEEEEGLLDHLGNHYISPTSREPSTPLGSPHLIMEELSRELKQIDSSIPTSSMEDLGEGFLPSKLIPKDPILDPAISKDKVGARKSSDPDVYDEWDVDISTDVPGEESPEPFLNSAIPRARSAWQGLTAVMASAHASIQNGVIALSTASSAQQDPWDLLTMPDMASSIQFVSQPTAAAHSPTDLFPMDGSALIAATAWPNESGTSISNNRSSTVDPIPNTHSLGHSWNAQARHMSSRGRSLRGVPRSADMTTLSAAIAQGLTEPNLENFSNHLWDWGRKLVSSSIGSAVKGSALGGVRVSGGLALRSSPSHVPGITKSIPIPARALSHRSASSGGSERAHSSVRSGIRESHLTNKSTTATRVRGGYPGLHTASSDGTPKTPKG
jgi:hypothetical protein